MSPRALFGVVVRSAGFFVCLGGVHTAIDNGWRFVVNAAYRTVGEYPPAEFIQDLAPALGWLLTGFLVLRFADRIARFAYRGRRAGACEECGYDLRGSPGRCPECGAEAPPAKSV